MGDALRDRLSDRGSIPLRSIYGTSRKDSIYDDKKLAFILKPWDGRQLFFNEINYLILIKMLLF